MAFRASRNSSSSSVGDVLTMEYVSLVSVKKVYNLLVLPMLPGGKFNRLSSIVIAVSFPQHNSWILRSWPPFPSLGALIFSVPFSLVIWLPYPSGGLSSTKFGSLMGLGWRGHGSPDYAHSSNSDLPGPSLLLSAIGQFPFLWTINLFLSYFKIWFIYF